MFLCHSVYPQQAKLGDFGVDGTLARHRINDIQYVLVEDAVITDSFTVSEVILKRSLLTEPAIDFTIQIFNVLLDKEYLAVFSVLPSLKSKDPVWNKMSLDSITSSLLRFKDIKKDMIKAFAAYNDPVAKYGRVQYPTYWNYVLVKKERDGYYRTVSDCLTQFFLIENNPHHKAVSTTAYGLNLAAPLLSIAEYESVYKRKFSEYSVNSRWGVLEFTNFLDNSNVPFVNLSAIEEFQGQKAYRFWLQDSWKIYSNNSNRGMDRFVYVPTIGIVGASYDFYMPFIEEYWANGGKIITRVPKEKFKPYTPFYHSSRELLDYLTEDYIRAFQINKKMVKY